LVCGQSACLVGANDVGAAKGLDTGKVANNRVLLSHFLGAERQASCNDGRKTFGDGCDGQGNSNLEIVNSALQRASMGRIPKMTDVYKPDEDTDDCDDLGEHVSKVIQLAFEWSLFCDLGSNGLVDVANSSASASKDYDSFGGSVDDGSSLKDSWSDRGFSLGGKVKNVLRRACWSCPA
jgi:hypothetical protein